MAIGRTNTGGGASLNYNVIGSTTEPAKKENTIWVNTENVTSHVFSATGPESPVPGMVWFVLNTRSDVSFNALKKGVFMVYPYVCNQYINGVWSAVNAFVCKNNEWLNIWDGIIYQHGIFNLPYAEEVTNGTMTLKEDVITVKTMVNKLSIVNVRLGKLRMDGITKLSANFKARDGVNGSHACDLFLAQATGVTYDTATLKTRANISTGTGSTTASLDLSSSNLTGDYYVYVGTTADKWGNERELDVSLIRATL